MAPRARTRARFWRQRNTMKMARKPTMARPQMTVLAMMADLTPDGSDIRSSLSGRSRSRTCSPLSTTMASSTLLLTPTWWISPTCSSTTASGLSATCLMTSWAVSTVMTRQNAVVSADGGDLTQALIPLWDMCNHADGKLSTDFNVALDRSECVAWRAVPAGEQVFIFYGERPNCDRLIHNGFVQPRSACDAVRVRLGVARADPLHAEKAALLPRLGLAPSGDWELERWTASPDVESLLLEDCPQLDAELNAKAWAFLQ
ncbi:hypothetical protein FOCC_FOCC001027, partial [Frankliniella occidentalis]